MRPSCMAGWLSYKLLISECVIISAAEKQPETRSARTKILKLSAGSTKARGGLCNEKWNQKTNSRKRMFGDVNTDTCCLTGSTRQFLPYGISAIKGGTQTKLYHTTAWNYASRVWVLKEEPVALMDHLKNHNTRRSITSYITVREERNMDTDNSRY